MNPFKSLILVLTVLLCFPLRTKAQMSAHYISVGQAESILLEFKTAGNSH